jgi:hypothetical protein
MGLFEQHPWLLIVLVVVTVELWAAIKAGVRHALRAREKPPAASEPARR